MITVIKYGLTKNLGDYNSERIDAEYMVSEGQCPMQAMAELKTFVTTGTLTVAKKEEVKEVVKKEEPKKEEVKEEPKKEEVKAPAKKAPAKKAAVAKATKPKEILYSRDVKEHKAMLAVVLGEDFPTWKQDAEIKAKALETSQALEGVAVMDNKGTMLDSFRVAVQDLMNGPEL